MKKLNLLEFSEVMKNRKVKVNYSFSLYKRFFKFKFYLKFKLFKLNFFKFMNKKYFVFFDFLKWKIYDFFKFFLKRKKIKPYFYGIYGFLGIFGSGKTISIVQKLNSYRKFYGNNIYIFTNFNYKYQTSNISYNFNEFFKMYDKPCIFAVDEIQNYFNSSVRTNADFVKFNTILTQVRKGNGKLIFWSAQNYEAVQKQIRLLTTDIHTCTTRANRLVFVNVYGRQAYEDRISRVRIDNIVKVRSSLSKSYSFVQSDYLRSCYNSFGILSSSNFISQNLYGYNSKKLKYKIVSNFRLLYFDNNIKFRFFRK